MGEPPRKTAKTPGVCSLATASRAAIAGRWTASRAMTVFAHVLSRTDRTPQTGRCPARLPADTVYCLHLAEGQGGRHNSVLNETEPTQQNHHIAYRVDDL